MLKIPCCYYSSKCIFKNDKKEGNYKVWWVSSKKEKERYYDSKVKTIFHTFHRYKNDNLKTELFFRYLIYTEM